MSTVVTTLSMVVTRLSKPIFKLLRRNGLRDRFPSIVLIVSIGADADWIGSAYLRADLSGSTAAMHG